GVYFLTESTRHPTAGRSYNFYMELAGYSVLTMGIWFKLFPIVFLIAALVQRARQGMWRSAGLGVGVFALLSVLINAPLALSNFGSWYFFIWEHQNRVAEPRLWYWLLGGMDPGLISRPDVNAAVNILSLLTVFAGGVIITALAGRSAHRHFLMPLGRLL